MGIKMANTPAETNRDYNSAKLQHEVRELKTVVSSLVLVVRAMLTKLEKESKENVTH